MSENLPPNSENAEPEKAVPLNKRLERMAGRLAIFLLLRPIQTMPLPLAQSFGRLLGNVMYQILPRYRNVALKNLTLVYGQEKSPREIKSMTKEVFRHFGSVATEFVKLPQMSRAEVDRLAVVEGDEYLCEALESGKGALMISGHFGNWEFMSRYITAHGFPLSVVARDTRDPVATKIMEDTRLGAGAKILYRGSSARAVVQCLRKNEMVGLLPDQNAADVFVPFFGLPTGTVDGPAVLHLLTKSPILFAWCVRLPDSRFKIVIEPPEIVPSTGDRDADIARITALINARLEAQVREHPTQWLWLHDRWKASPGVFPEGEANRIELLTPHSKSASQADAAQGGSHDQA